MSAAWELGALSVLAAALGFLAVWIASRLRTSPARREQRRRVYVSATGRIIDGEIVEASPQALFFTYSVSGVRYHASQDITQLTQLLPGDPAKLAGPVWLKYSPKNPANSIVLCENWSGFRGIKEMQSK